jgi:hypothetical protein
VVGKFCRYGKRVVFLPWNFHKLYAMFQEAFQRQERALNENQAVVRQFQEALIRQEGALRQNQTLLRQVIPEQLRALADQVHPLREQLRAQGERLEQMVEARQPVGPLAAEETQPSDMQKYDSKTLHGFPAAHGPGSRSSAA